MNSHSTNHAGVVRRRALVALSLLLATTANATTFDFSYTYGSSFELSGSLDGDINGDCVENISNVSVFYEGVAAPGPINLIGHWDESLFWLNSDPVVSFDATKNNFVFGDSGFSFWFWMTEADFTGGTLHNQAASLVSPFRNEDVDPQRWALTEHEVPEAPTWAAAGFLGLVGGLTVWRRSRR